MIRVGLARSDAGYAKAEATVRAALSGLGLDAARRATPEWNPLGELVAAGGRVVLKPNFIRHWNPLAAERSDATVESVITHGAVVRAVAELAFRAVGKQGSVAIAEAPQQDCDFDEIRRLAGLDEMVADFRERLGATLEVIDLRREAVVFRDGIIQERRALPGDPAGYRVVDLGEQSFFTGSGLDPRRFRGADYDPGPTSEHHMGGRNEYLLSETVLAADLLVNLPKLKTHKKTGVTLALKNLVGVNGDKNWLPHHSLGASGEGGDEFPPGRRIDAWRSRATEWARPWLARGRFLKLFQTVRRVESRTRGDDFVRSGNWHGNDTTWRMCCDLNRCVYYSDRKGLHLDAPAPVRPVLTVLDGIVAGEGDGPLAPVDVPLGVVLAATDPVALDLAAVRLMGFDAALIAKLREPMRAPGPRITALRDASELRIGEATSEASEPVLLRHDQLEVLHPFAPHRHWVGHIEEAR